MHQTPTRTPQVPLPALLSVLVPAMLLMIVASDMVNLVLPRIGRDFGASEAELAWVVTGFLLVFAVGVPFYGRISDRIGMRTLFACALAGYAAGSLVSAFAPTLLVLVTGRVVTGAGAAAIPVLSVIAVTRLLPPGRRGTGIGFISAASGVGTAAGPAVGGGLGQALGWPGLFLVTAGCAVLLIPAAVRLLPADAPGDDRPFDIAGGVLLGLAAGLLLLGVTLGQGAGFTAPSALGSLLGAVAAGALFVRRTRRARHPFVDPAMFANRVYSAATGTVLLAMLVNLTALVFVPVMLVDANGLTPGGGALVMIPGGVAFAVVSPLVGRLVPRAGARNLTVAGLAAMALSMLALSFLAGAPPAATAVVVLCLDLGFAFVATSLTDLAAGALPPTQVGVGLGLFQGAQFLGAGAGPAIVGALVAARQHAATALNPWYVLAAPAYSDAFLVLAGVAVLAAVVALRLRSAARTRVPDPATTPSRS